ncbi:thioredoxin domain-containing protein [Hahella ganghwensis]|uniref:thioredoxin domain-containing protein n=1 Tax=Hahella ganghwensis TaxID=286420 RepID=UPI0003781E1A|nr:thioredoxin domain-containing protein [Hahella ganghwensis]
MENLREIQRSKQELYNVRTRHLDQDGQPRFINHLIHEQSPYLLQHAHNPVNWRSWNEETLQQAESCGLPVFLSIGYSTCHWCHVMEEESFDDLEVAELLNRHFVPVKVDREQRPDLDEIYMTAIQIISGQGGWPMSVFLTPRGHPFFGATYFTKPQFIRLLKQISHLWSTEQDNLIEQGDRLQQAIQQHLSPPVSTTLPGHDLIEAARSRLLQMTDKRHGGFGTAPKFPQEPNLLFLLDQIARDDRPLTRIPEWELVSKTLDNMLQGGIYDHVGGGFHRYAVDNAWQIPHFEKMLYNQAQMIRVYTQAFQLSGNPEYQRIATEIINFALNEMRTEDGLFHSATDADSQGESGPEEGQYFVWTYAEMKKLLSGKDWSMVRKVYDISRSGNYSGRNILHLSAPLDKLAESLSPKAKCSGEAMTYSQLVERLGQIKAILLDYRANRPAPAKDTKVITEWNGMMVAALAEASRILNTPSWLTAAIHTAETLWQIHRQPEGLLWRLSMDRISSDPAYLEDYAHLMEGLLQIYDTNHEHIWLERTEALLTTVKEHYWDSDGGGFFTTGRTHPGPLPVRSKSLGDHATVCGNSQILNVLTALFERTGDLLIQTTTREHLSAFALPVRQHPLMAPYFLKGLAAVESPSPSAIQYSGAGQIWARLSRGEQTDSGHWEYSLEIHMSEGWHIQSHQCQDNQGQNTKVQLLSDQHHECLDIRYPPPSPWSTNSEEALEIYADHCEINLTLKLHRQAPVRLQLDLQACNETSCHQPHKLLFSQWL